MNHQSISTKVILASFAFATFFCLDASAEIKTVFHHAGKHESVESLSFLYETSVESIKAANPNLKRKLKEGQTVVVPIDSDEPDKSALVLEELVKAVQPAVNQK